MLALTVCRHSSLQQGSFHSLSAVFINSNEGCMNTAHSCLNTELHNPAPDALNICSTGPLLLLQRTDQSPSRQPVNGQPAETWRKWIKLEKQTVNVTPIQCVSMWYPISSVGVGQKWSWFVTGWSLRLYLTVTVPSEPPELYEREKRQIFIIKSNTLVLIFIK